MIDSVAFRTRARTIDHLGREQIADCPTAISELWKNAYDAYARSVALEIYDGPIPVAAIVDDGHGMDREEFETKWLVIGTESKATDLESPPPDRRGLSVRTKQGQKGIGRLSSAYLGSLLLLVSKRETSPFVASLIDWRLFENPFIYLQDVEIPIVEFDKPEELWRHLPELFDRLMGNVWGNGKDAARDHRLTSAWQAFDALEQRDGRSSTRSAIEEALIETGFADRHLESWPVWSGSSLSGTALVMGHIAYDLQAQLNSATESDDDAARQAKDKLLQTLVNFNDPFVSPAEDQLGLGIKDFGYSATAWNGDLARVIISSTRVFTYENLEDLEHVIEGKVDEAGRFVGRVKAFGTWLAGEVVIPPLAPVMQRPDSAVGSFHVRIGTYESQLANSTLSEAIHSHIVAQVARYGGFMVFRNGLRVMPYGRVDNDFFEIEQRRSQHAGREFWSNRRMFGRVALTREHNPNLRDKAGREGLIDNRAAKVFRDLVTNILSVAARRYFGSDSDIREKRLPEIVANYRKQKAEEAEQKIRQRRRRTFRKNLESGLPKMLDIEQQLSAFAKAAEDGLLPQTEAELIELRRKMSELKAERASLALGSPPTVLGSLEKSFAEFKRASASSADLVNQLTDSISFSLEKIKPKSAKDAAFAELSRNAAFLHGRLRKWNLAAKEILAGESGRLAELLDERNKRYHAFALPLLAELEEGKQALPKVLDELERERDRQDLDNSELFESYISILQSLQDRIDLDTLVLSSMEEVEEARAELTRLNALAQLGITVEIIGHEMDGLEQAISSGLAALPAEARRTQAFERVRTAHQALMEKLRFLSPLKLSGERVRSWISGADLVTYIRGFMGESLERREIQFDGTGPFMRFRVYEQPSRVFPVFINLINNAAYWIEHAAAVERRILLDVVDNKVLVADSGPGVDAADTKHLFTLFFTRKIRSGRGVGLYLCRTNLAAGGHTVKYVTDSSVKRLPGANFLIDFKGAQYD